MWCISKSKLLIILSFISILSGCGDDSDEKTITNKVNQTKEYNVTTQSDNNGSITPPNVTVEHGATTTFTVKGNEGFEIDEVSGCKGKLSGNLYTTAPVTTACSVDAKFKKIRYTVTAKSDGNGSITSPN
ncbi:InlB B-repeat-containing protein, partial [Pseudoalteromonas sp. '520P1 No. 412']